MKFLALVYINLVTIAMKQLLLDVCYPELCNIKWMDTRPDLEFLLGEI